jgi:hypothetical protein
LNDYTSVAEQNKLQIQISNFNLVSGGAMNGVSAGFGDRKMSVQVIEKHCTDLLALWKKIEGNDISSPASFNWRLLTSISSHLLLVGQARVSSAGCITGSRIK